MGRRDKGPSEPCSPSSASGMSVASCALSAHTQASLTPPNQELTVSLGLRGGEQFPARCLHQGFIV